MRIPQNSTDYTLGSEFTVRRSTISSNSALYGGGGIRLNSGDGLHSVIEDTTVTGNEAGLALSEPANGDNVPNAGGGLYAYMHSLDLSPTRLTISGSTFDANVAGMHGGGIAICTKRTDTSNPGDNSGGRVAIVNSTISGNIAGANGDTGTGGGMHFAIYDFSESQREAVNVEIHNVTVTGNIADQGGGIYSLVPQVPQSRTNVKLRNTIVSGNKKHDGGAHNFWGSINRLETRFNLISDTASPPPQSNVDDNSFWDHNTHNALLQNITTITAPTPFGPGNNNNNNGTNDPLLTPLADFGGITKCHEIKTNSPAIDAGDDNLANFPFTFTTLAYDQRGAAFLRFLDGDGSGGKGGIRVDIGAVETSKSVRVAGVTIGSSDSAVVHPDYQVPDHLHTNPFTNTAASQVTSIPVTRPNEITIRFSNAAVVSSLGSSTFSVLSLAPVGGTACSYTIANIVPILVPNLPTLASGVNFEFTCMVNMSANPDFSDQFKIIVNPTVLDEDNEQLDGEWTNPTFFNNGTGSRFPSGDGSPGGQFVFKVTVLRADFNHDNVVDGSDFGIWNMNNFTYPKTRTTYYNGDVTAEGSVDGSDYGIWNSMKFTVNWQAPARGPDNEWLRQQIDYLVRIYGVLQNDGVTVNSDATVETWHAFAAAVEAVFSGEGYVDVDGDDEQNRDGFGDEEWYERFWNMMAEV